MRYVKRALNEFIPICGAIVGLLVLTGQLTATQAADWMEWLAGVGVIVATVVFRQNNDGPVTLLER